MDASVTTSDAARVSESTSEALNALGTTDAARQEEESRIESELHALYSKYNPGNIAKIPHIRATFRGREEVLLHNLYEKYDVHDNHRRPTMTSAKIKEMQQRFQKEDEDDNDSVMESNRGLKVSPTTTQNDNNDDHGKKEIKEVHRTTKEGDYLVLMNNTLDVGLLSMKVQEDSAGAISTFIGVTRNYFENKAVKSLEYEANEVMALNCMEDLCGKIRAKFPVAKVLIAHKLGSCPVGHVSVLIAVSSGHRKESLDATAFAINELKATIPIWKKETYEREGEECAWKENKEFRPVLPSDILSQLDLDNSNDNEDNTGRDKVEKSSKGSSPQSAKEHANIFTTKSDESLSPEQAPNQSESMTETHKFLRRRQEEKEAEYITKERDRLNKEERARVAKAMKSQSEGIDKNALQRKMRKAILDASDHELGKKAVEELNEAFAEDPLIDELGVVMSMEGMFNDKGNVAVVSTEHKLGIVMGTMKAMFSYCSSRFNIDNAHFRKVKANILFLQETVRRIGIDVDTLRENSREQFMSLFTTLDTISVDLMHNTRGILVVRGDMPAALNARKAVLLYNMNVAVCKEELRLLEVIFTLHPKSPSAWHHRRWVMHLQHHLEVTQAQEAQDSSQYQKGDEGPGGGYDRDVDRVYVRKALGIKWNPLIRVECPPPSVSASFNTHSVATTIGSIPVLSVLLSDEQIRHERKLCNFVNERYPKNYFGWMHRRWLLAHCQQHALQELRYHVKYLRENNDYSEYRNSLFDEELTYTRDWLFSHTSDHCAVSHYHQTLTAYLAVYLEVGQDAALSCGSVSRDVLSDALKGSRKLIIDRPGYESLWYTHRYMISLLLNTAVSSFQRSQKAYDRDQKELSIRLTRLHLEKTANSSSDARDVALSSKLAQLETSVLSSITIASLCKRLWVDGPTESLYETHYYASELLSEWLSMLPTRASPLPVITLFVEGLFSLVSKEIRLVRKCRQDIDNWNFQKQRLHSTRFAGYLLCELCKIVVQLLHLSDDDDGANTSTSTSWNRSKSENTTKKVVPSLTTFGAVHLIVAYLKSHGIQDIDSFVDVEKESRSESDLSLQKVTFATLYGLKKVCESLLNEDESQGHWEKLLQVVHVFDLQPVMRKTNTEALGLGEHKSTQDSNIGETERIGGDLRVEMMGHQGAHITHPSPPTSFKKNTHHLHDKHMKRAPAEHKSAN